MTNEETMTNGFARIVLVQLNTDEQLNVREHEAIRVAIKALEQQTCEDAVSRKDVLNLVDNLNDGSFRWASIRTKIARLHLVQPELEPCEEELDFVQEHKKISCNLIVEPCEDAISREDALMALTGEWTDSTDELIHRFIRRIKKLPPVNPQRTVCEDAVSRQAVKEFVEYIQTIKDKHNDEGLSINYGTICDLVIRGWKLVESEDVINKPINRKHCGAKMVEPQESEVSE